MQKKFEDVNKLINCLHKNSDQNFKQSIRTYSQSIFKSFLGQSSTSNQDINYWKNKIINKIQQTYDSRSVMQCQQACNRFLTNNIITKKCQTLKMLYRLSEQIANAGMNPSFDVSFLSSQEKSIPRKSHNLNQTQPTLNYSNNNITNNMSYVQGNNISNINNNNKNNLINNQQLALIRYRGCAQLSISEGDILKQIISRFMDIVAQHMVIDNYGQCMLKPNIKVSDTVRKIIKELSEIGWLYSKINEECGGTGVVTKALKLGVRQQMTQYYRWIAVIQNMIGKQLTLRKLILWSYQPFQKLKWMLIILQAAKPFNGCQIISIINSYRPQGSNSINQLLNRLLTHLLQPLFQFIYNWVYRGQLTDQYGEFFICVNKNKNNQDVKQCFQWDKKFSLEQKNIPNLLDYDSAVKIFSAGKTIYFMKNHCKIDYNLQVPFFDIKTALSDKLYESTSILSTNFKIWLQNISKNLSNYLVQIMFNKFDLKKHFNAIKMFYLAGKGDFIQALIDSLKDQLSKPKHQIAQHNLQRFISDAISQCFPKINQINSITNNKKIITIEEEIVARLTAKKVQSGSSQGWDVFNFQYSVQQAPLNTIFSQPIIQKYQKIFSFLWKVKRIEQNLKQLWLNSVKDYDHSQKPAILHQCQILRQQMYHFVNNLHGYLMISIQSCWDTFCKQIDKAKSFDKIIILQDKLIQQLLQITLNSNKSKNAHTCLNSVFSSILKFASIQKDLIKKYSDYTQQRRQYENKKNLIKRGVIFQKEIQTPIFKTAGLKSNIKQIIEIYHRSFQRFYDVIKKDSQSRICTLCFRLDFSGFYSSAQPAM